MIRRGGHRDTSSLEWIGPQTFVVSQVWCLLTIPGESRRKDWQLSLRLERGGRDGRWPCTSAGLWWQEPGLGMRVRHLGGTRWGDPLDQRPSFFTTWTFLAAHAVSTYQTSQESRSICNFSKRITLDSKIPVHKSWFEHSPVIILCKFQCLLQFHLCYNLIYVIILFLF